jgi:predicted DNA-binding transcriptional regulator AlpA
VSNKSTKQKHRASPSSVPPRAEKANAEHIAAKGLAADTAAHRQHGKVHGARAPPRLLYKADIVAITGATYVTIWRWMQQGKFPRSRTVGASATSKAVWLASEVDQWLASLPLKRLKGDAAA